MLADWLESGDRPDGSFERFGVSDVTERQAISDAVKDLICAALRDSAADAAFLREAAKYVGWLGAHAIVQQRLPTVVTARRGRFGETVGVCMLEEFDGYVVPIEKGHSAITGGQSQPGTDAVVIRVADGAVSEVCFVESKLRTVTDNHAGVEATRQLETDYALEYPAMLTFTASRLHERSDSLFTPFMQYMASRMDLRSLDSFRVLLFYDSSTWSEQTLVNVNDEEPKLAQLHLHVVRIDGLADLVSDIFQRVGIALIAED